MWVFEEMVDGRKLTEIINTTHENVKYLKGKQNRYHYTTYNNTVKASKVIILV